MNEVTSKMLMKKSNIISKVLIGVNIFFGVTLIQSIIGIGLCIFNPTFVEQQLATPGTILNVFVNQGANEATINMAKTFLTYNLVHIILFMICFTLGYFIFKEIKHTINPFSSTIIKRIKIISVLTALNLCSVNAFIGLGIGIIIFGIAIVFEYGAKLQQLSDETL